jgi:hypothetical protein
MDGKQTRAVSSSRFHFQQVSTSKLRAVAVDPGCQRCQHCTMVWRATIVGLSAPGHSIPGRKLENKGGHPCP